MVVESYSANGRDINNSLVRFLCLLVLLFSVGDLLRRYYAGEFLVYLPETINSILLIRTYSVVLRSSYSSRSSRYRL